MWVMLRQIRHISRIILDCFFDNDCVAHKTSIQTSLFDNTILSANSQIVTGFAWNRHRPWFGCVCELPMTTPGCAQYSPIVLDDPANFTERLPGVRLTEGLALTVFTSGIAAPAREEPGQNANQASKDAQPM